VLAKLFSTADVVVHTCTDEPFPLNVAEAQASGTPVVAFESAGNREVIRDGETGLLVAPGDVKGLADSILMILEDPEMREGMGELAREFVLEKYEIGDSAEKYIALWRNLAPHALWQTTTSMHLDDLEEFKREAAGN
jgi:glycosyltransferase involved in cell wall biosynthesis